MTILTKMRTLLAAASVGVLAATAGFADGIEALDTAPEDAVIVNIDKLKYVTPEITIKVGDAVTWTNLEVMPHDVNFAKEKVRGDMLNKDQSWSARFTQAGTFDYHCSPHPFMRGKVIVEE